MPHPVVLIGGLVLLILTFQNVLAWWRGWTLRPSDKYSDDYTIVVPVYGKPKYFANREALEDEKHHVLLAMDDAPGMREFAHEIAEDGWASIVVPMSEPNPPKLESAVVKYVHTKWFVRMDGDTVPDEGLGHAVKAAEESGADICSVRCEVLHPRSIAERLQQVEYRVSMLTRRYRPWMTSGAAFIVKTEAMQRIMDYHTCWPAAEDVETGRIALALKMKIRHLDYCVRTDAPTTWRAWCKQRTFWWCGNVRHILINLDRNAFRMPTLTLYYVLGVWLALQTHVWQAFSENYHVIYLPIILVAFLFITAISNLQALSPWMILFPLYALFQSVILPPFGFVKYLRLARSKRSLGRYQF